MSKPLSKFLNAIVFFLLALLPLHSFADRFFEDNEAFFLKYLEQQKFPLDTSASAIVLYECHTYAMSSSQMRVRKIIKIIKKSGSEYANIVIALPGNRSGYYFTGVSRIHGTTYNLESGKMVKQEIDADNITMEKSGMVNEKKIAMPAVREGSVIDYSYEIDGFSLSKWNVQEAIPKLYTKLEIYTAQEITFDADDNKVPVFITLDENKKNVIDSLLPYSYTYRDLSTPIRQCFVRKNVAAFDDEPFLPCESNYREFLRLNIKAEHIKIDDYPDYMQEYIKSLHYDRVDFAFNTWGKINAALLESFNFSRSIVPGSLSIKEKAAKLAGSETDELSIARKIYKFVRDSVSASGGSSMFTEKDLSKVLEQRSGNTAEINFLLIALLRQAGLSSSPVILATKDNATPSSLQPELFKYNYTICLLRVNGEKYYLDAAEKYNPFGRLPPDCLNGYARVIDKKDTCGVIFKPDMDKEKSLCAVTTTNSSIDGYTLNYKFYYGDEAATQRRTEWNKDTAEIRKSILASIKEMPLDAKLKDFKILNLNDPEQQLRLDYSISISWPEGGNTIYLNPYAIKFFETNPFKNPVRKNPVELPATQNLTYTFNLKLPDGYTVDEVPKSAVIKIDDNDQYKNMITYNKGDNTLNIYSRLQMQRIFYPVGEYSTLKEFFQKMGDEQQTNIVLKYKH